MLLILLSGVSAFGAEPSNAASCDLVPPHATGNTLGKQEVAEDSAEKLLESRIKEEKEVVFIPWNGKLPEDGSRCTLRFRQQAQVRLDFFGYDIRWYFGCFSFIKDCLIETQIKSDTYHSLNLYWPRMRLRRDGEDLLLYREDGETWWHDIYPKAGKPSQRDNWPFYPKSIDGFWPLRATEKNKAEQVRNPK